MQRLPDLRQDSSGLKNERRSLSWREMSNIESCEKVGFASNCCRENRYIFLMSEISNSAHHRRGWMRNDLYRSLYNKLKCWDSQRQFCKQVPLGFRERRLRGETLNQGEVR